MSDAAGEEGLVFAPTMDCSGVEEGAEACRKKPPLPEVGQDQCYGLGNASYKWKMYRDRLKGGPQVA